VRAITDGSPKLNNALRKPPGMKALFSSLVGHPAVYYSLAVATLFAFVGLAVAKSEALAKKRLAEWGFLVLAGVTLLIWHLPVLPWPQPLNIDEGQWAACALKATCDFAPWRGFDATTSGPLNGDVLALPALFGAPITFFSTRMIGQALLAGAICAFYFITKWTHEAATARLALVAPVCFLALTWDWDFLHYSSEELPIFLTTLGIAGGTYLVVGRQNRQRIAAVAAAGICLGAAGFAKLQVMPVVLAGAAFVASTIYFTTPSRRQGRLEGLCFAVGLLAVPLTIATSLTVTGDWNHALTSYIKFAFIHVTSGSTVGFDFFFRMAESYGIFAGCTLALILIGVLTLRGRWSFTKRSLTITFWASGLLLVSLVVIVTPRHAYPHYLLFSVFPLSYALATVLRFTREAGVWNNRETLVAATIAALFVTPALGATLAHPNPFLGEMRALLLRAPAESLAYLPFQNTSAHVQAIGRHAPPGTRISIWGWMPHYYVQTQTIMATRDAHTKLQQTPGPLLEYYRERYLGELRSNPPPVFVDAVAPASFGYNQRATDGIESFPALSAFIGGSYHLAEEVAGVRIFTLKKRGHVEQH
jgi:4-amino-4-deoxy-L-arabinose transferase-like glycosyltransferase